MRTTSAAGLLLAAMLLSVNVQASKPISDVTLFMAPWCGYCMQAKAYMAKHDITYREYDVDTAAGQKAFERMGGTRDVPAGKRGIPFLVWQGKEIRGFQASRYAEFFRLPD